MRSTLHDIQAFLFVLIAVGLVFAACSVPTEVDIPLTLVPTPIEIPTDIAPTPEPPPPKTLVVCLNQEPTSLYLYSDAYLYGSANRESNAVLQAIYDGPIDIINYEFHPVILQELPDLAGGKNARLEEVTILEGDVYLNPVTLQPEVLTPGKPYLPAGCEGSECIQTYQGGEAIVQRLVVDFHLLPELTWSDGEPLTAADSVFSYELDLHGDTPTTKYLVDRTYTYQALDEVTVRWTGIPGFLDTEYAANFWSPLPAHILEGYTPAELLAAEEVNARPIGWGPYVIQEWRAGDHILLAVNPNYYRASEDLPNFDFLIFRFLGSDVTSAVQQLLTGECDLLDESLLPDEALPMLIEFEESGRLELAWVPGAEMERFDFNLAPVDQSAENALFDDVRTRRAIASCIDRQSIVDEILFGLSAVPDTYISPFHPHYQTELDSIQYDVSAAQEMLQEIGWRDDDGSPETPRVATGVPGIHSGTPLAFTYLTTGDGIRQAVAEALKADLAQCGVEMTVEFYNPDVITAPWPEGPVFGRGFDAVVWSWPDWISPLCEMFAGREIPSNEYPYGSNASAFDNQDYNLACDTILLGPAGSQTYLEAVRQTQEIFTNQLPALPLYLKPRIVAYTEDMCGIEVDPLAFSAFWNLEMYNSGNECSD